MFTSRSSEERVALLLENSTDELALGVGCPLDDFCGGDIDLLPSHLFQSAYGSTEDHSTDASPQNCPLTHAARFRGCVETQFRPIGVGTDECPALDCIDFTVPHGTRLRIVEALCNNLASDPIDEQRSERSLWITRLLPRWPSP